MKKMADLQLSDFDRCAVWQTVPEETHDSRDELVRPLPEKSSICDGESDLWVRFSGTLADGTAVQGVAMAEAPPPDLLLWSFRVGNRWLVLHLSPAPDFVLQKTGPIPFAKAMSKPVNQVFPIRIHSDVKADSTGEAIVKEIGLVK